MTLTAWLLLAILLALAVYGTIRGQQVFERGQAFNRRFGERYGEGARLLLAAIAGAAFVLFVLVFDFTGRFVLMGPVVAGCGVMVLSVALYQYVRHRLGQR